MKILLISAGTHIHGATERAALEAERTIRQAGETCETFRLYTESTAACNGCGACKKSGSCIHADSAQRLADAVEDFDGYIFFSPVHYGGATGALKTAMGRLFFSRHSVLEYKPAAAVAVSRRGGNVTAVEEMTRFFSFASMPCVFGNYPAIIHGTGYAEAERDLEGLQTVRSVAENMVWLIRCIEAGRSMGIRHPTPEKKIKTDYIR